MRIASILGLTTVFFVGCSGGEDSTESHGDAEPDTTSSGDGGNLDAGRDTTPPPTDTSDSGGALDASDAFDASDTFDAGPPTSFVKTFPKTTGDRYGRAAVYDTRDGSVIFVGDFSGTLDFGGGVMTGSDGGTDIFVVKFDRNGKHVWSKQFGEGSGIGVSTVAVDASGNVFFGGALSASVDFGGGRLTSAGGQDAWLVKLDPSGKHLWSKRFGDASETTVTYSIAITPSGQLLVGGLFKGTINFGGSDLVDVAGTSSASSYIAKFESNGSHVWSKSFGSYPGDDIYSVASDKDGAMIVAGAILGDVDYGGGVMHSAGFLDAFVAKFDKDGVYQWAHSYGDSGLQRAISVAVDSTGSVVFATRGNGTLDFGGGPTTSSGMGEWITKLSPTGAFVWSKSFPGTSSPEAGELYVATNAANDVLVWGDTIDDIDFGGGNLPSKGLTDLVVARFTSAGTHVASKRFGDAAGQFAGLPAVSPSGVVALSGWYKGTIDFGLGSITAGSGGFDLIIAQTPAP